MYAEKNHVHQTDILGYNVIHSRSVATDILVIHLRAIYTTTTNSHLLSAQIAASSLMERYHHSHYGRETVGGFFCC